MQFAAFSEETHRCCVITNVGGECSHETLVGFGALYLSTDNYERNNNIYCRRDSRPRLYREKCGSRTRVRGALPADSSVGSCYSHYRVICPVPSGSVRSIWTVPLLLWADVSDTAVTPHPTLSPNNTGERRVFSFLSAPRVALRHHLPWATIGLPRWGCSLSRVASAKKVCLAS